MPRARAVSKSVVVTLNEASPKGNVVRFDGSDNEDALRTIYVGNAAIKKIGNPEAIKVTIEAA